MSPKTQKVQHPAVPEFDPRAGETASQDVAPTDEDIRLEALQRRHALETPDLDDVREAVRSLKPGLGEADVEREQPPIRGPRSEDGRGRVVREDETVADRAADADAADDEPDDAIGSDDA